MVLRYHCNVSCIVGEKRQNLSQEYSEFFLSVKTEAVVKNTRISNLDIQDWNVWDSLLVSMMGEGGGVLEDFFQEKKLKKNEVNS